MDLYRAIGHSAEATRALNDLGWHHALAGNLEPALAHCQEALALLGEIGDRYGQAASWDSFGYIQHRMGRHGQATAAWRQALDMLDELGHPDAAKIRTKLRELGHRRDRSGTPADESRHDDKL